MKDSCLCSEERRVGLTKKKEKKIDIQRTKKVQGHLSRSCKSQK